MSDWFTDEDVEKAADAIFSNAKPAADVSEEEARSYARAALSAVKPKSEWRPIDEAPKMKTILLFGPIEVGEDGAIKNWRMETGFWHSGYADDPEYSPWEWGGHQHRKYAMQPTHWQPLPPAPTEE